MPKPENGWGRQNQLFRSWDTIGKMQSLLLPDQCIPIRQKVSPSLKNLFPAQQYFKQCLSGVNLHSCCSIAFASIYAFEQLLSNDVKMWRNKTAETFHSSQMLIHLAMEAQRDEKSVMGARQRNEGRIESPSVVFGRRWGDGCSGQVDTCAHHR